MIISNICPVFASDFQTQAIYSLEKGGNQSFLINDEYGATIQVDIIKLDSSKNRIANDIYEIKLTFPGAWTAGFYTEISNNKFIKVYSPFHAVLSGSIKNATLSKHSNVKASYSFIHKKGVLNYNTGVLAIISGSELVISKI